MGLYCCVYQINGVEHVARSTAVVDFLYGFWVDKEGEKAACSNSFLWVPPSAIKFITRESDLEAAQATLANPFDNMTAQTHRSAV